MMKEKGQLVGGLIVLVLMSTSCKKNYTCMCTNIGGPVDVFTIRDTKKKAQSECQEYYEKYYGYYWSETFCKIK